MGVRPALAMVRTHRSRIILTFVFGLLCFFLSAIATVRRGPDTGLAWPRSGMGLA